MNFDVYILAQTNLEFILQGILVHWHLRLTQRVNSQAIIIMSVEVSEGYDVLYKSRTGQVNLTATSRYVRLLEAGTVESGET